MGTAAVKQYPSCFADFTGRSKPVPRATTFAFQNHRVCGCIMYQFTTPGCLYCARLIAATMRSPHEEDKSSWWSAGKKRGCGCAWEELGMSQRASKSRHGPHIEATNGLMRSWSFLPGYRVEGPGKEPEFDKTPKAYTSARLARPFSPGVVPPPPPPLPPLSPFPSLSRQRKKPTESAPRL